MAGTPRLICASATLADGGRGVRFLCPRHGPEAAGFAVPYSPEYADLESNPKLLQLVSEVTGGKAYADTDDLPVDDDEATPSAPALPSGTSLPRCQWDPRAGCHRAPAFAYADIVRALVREKVPYEDTARKYLELAEGPRVHRELRRPGVTLAVQVLEGVGVIRATRGHIVMRDREKLEHIATRLHAFEVKPSGTEGYRTAEVTLGGVDTTEVSSKTMESKKQKGLYFVGEILDVTGHLGGFNFQWAWSSAHAASEYV